MNQQTSVEGAPQYADDEIDLRQLFTTLWAGKWLIIALAVVFAAGGVAFALSKPDIYQASVLVAPANDDGGRQGLSGQLGGLASLTGIGLGGGISNQTVIAKEVLQSRAFLSSFIRKHELDAVLKATTAWDIKSEQWHYNRELYNPDTGEWQVNGNGKSVAPTDWELVSAFRGALSLSEKKDAGMLTVSVKSLSPIVAKEWAAKLIADINEHMRREDVEASEARIAYLEGKLGETKIAGMQQVFFQLIESETRTIMLANAQPEYVFKTIDPAFVPQEKSEPKRALIAIVATMFGGMLGVFFVFVRAFIKTDNAVTKL